MNLDSIICPSLPCGDSTIAISNCIILLALSWAVEGHTHTNPPFSLSLCVCVMGFLLSSVCNEFSVPVEYRARWNE